MSTESAGPRGRARDRRRERHRACDRRAPRRGWAGRPQRRPEARSKRPGHPFAADLATRAGNRDAVNAAIEQFGRLDVVLPNAGFQHVAPIRDFGEDRWDAMVALLLTSPFLLARYAWPELTARGDGRFIAIASAHALVASPFKAAYVSAKHGVLGLVEDPRARRRRRRPARHRRLTRIRPYAAGRGPDRRSGGGSRHITGAGAGGRDSRRAAGQAPHRAGRGRRRGLVPRRTRRSCLQRHDREDGSGLDGGLIGETAVKPLGDPRAASRRPGSR